MDKPVKQIIFGEAVRKKILRGVEITAKAVSTTLGSRGRNVAIERNWGAPNIIHDGVTVAKAVTLKDPFENMGAQLVIHAANNTNNAAGDGTTTATILTHAITKEGLQLVEAGTNPMILRKGIEKAVDAVVKYLDSIAKPIKTFEEMKQVATISAADSEMGELIATAIKKVGENGAVAVQEGGTSIEVEYKDGMEFDKGYISPYMVTDPETFEANLEGKKESDYPYLIIANEKLTNETLVELVNKIYLTDQLAKILIIADDFDGDATATLIINRVQGRKLIVAVKAPDFGDHRLNYLTDLAIVTGGKVIGGSSGVPVSEATIAHFGRAERIKVTRDNTTVIGGQGDEAAIKAQITAVKKLKADTTDAFKKDKLENRLAKLVGGVAVIIVGAHSEAEMRERKERVYDAVNATKAAISEGIVAGGGVALVKARQAIDKLVLPPKQKLGADIVRGALSYPLVKLVDNAGENSGYILGIVEKSEDPYTGYNVDTEQLENLVESGIIDPVKVTKSALKNAASIATMLLTTESMIVYDRSPEVKKKDDGEGIGNFPD